MTLTLETNAPPSTTDVPTSSWLLRPQGPVILTHPQAVVDVSDATDDELARLYVSAVWAKDWNCAEDAVYDER
jgi:hypothetical protein